VRPEQWRGSSLFQPHAIGLLGFILGSYGQAVNNIHVALIYHKCMHTIGTMDMRAWWRHASGSLGHVANVKRSSADPEPMAGDPLGQHPALLIQVETCCIPYLNCQRGVSISPFGITRKHLYSSNVFVRVEEVDGTQMSV
jgi:hypothetical protein